MSDPIVARLHAWLKDHEAQLLADYRAMLQIASIEGPGEPNAPFGKENREALDLALQWGNESGMKTKDLDGYCGYAEFGQGDRLIGVFGHLDVVPVGPGWKHEPFGAEIDGDYVYARGAVDDKGPTMAAFFAARAVQACCPDLPARIRVVFGCDEESGFKCIEQYVAREEAPTFGVAPDAGWPLIHAEKGIANFLLRSPLPTGEMSLLEINGGQRPNIVIDSCSAKVRIADSARAHIDAKLADSWDKNVSFAWDSADVLQIDAIGKAAHGSWPYGGDNAAIRIFRFLMEIAPLSVQEAYGEIFSLNHIAGSGIGIDGRDEVSKDLTCNLGILETKDGEMEFTFNVRYPVTWNGDDMRARCEAFLASLKVEVSIADFHDSKPLYFPLEHPLVKTICDVYTEETGDTEKKPGVMGGGTYARAVPNTVAIGTGWLGDGDAHQTDERCAIESLYRMSRIYAHILWRLATV